MVDTGFGPDASPPAVLGGADLEQIVHAIVRGYDEAELTRLLRFNWGMELSDCINLRQGFHPMVSDLVAFTEKKGKTLELLKLAFSKNSGNPDLRGAAHKFHLVAEPDEGARPANLEAFVNKRSRLLSFQRFKAELSRAGERICRVETPLKQGTGFLVGPNLVLTNYHVVENIERKFGCGKGILCRFDYTEENAAGQVVTLAADWLVADSPYSESDKTGLDEPGPKELDYALLCLAENVGDTPSGAGPRGWFAMGPEMPIVALNDIVVIPQHPAGRPLEIAWGSIVEFPGSGTRVRYDVTTEQGSSGAPCFSADLELIGLHHAAEPRQNPRFNQAVPLWRIARDLPAGVTAPPAAPEPQGAA